MPDSIKDELIAKQQGEAETPSAAPAATPAGSTPTFAVPEDRAAAITDLYDKNVAAQKANLQAAYDQNLSNLEANRESIAKRYTAARNTAATDYERQRRNFNEQAMMNGLNTGVGSQAALAQNAAYQRQQGAINAAEGTDVSNLERSIADLKVKYQNDINSAIAENDYKRAAALMDEYNAAYSRAQQEAQLRASYGDFSGYVPIYGQEAADTMQSVWARQNPGIAYSLGYIDAETYRTLTGKYPVGYSAGGGGGGRRSYGGGSGGAGGGADWNKLQDPSSPTAADMATDMAASRAALESALGKDSSHQQNMDQIRIQNNINQVVRDANARAEAMSNELNRRYGYNMYNSNNLGLSNPYI